MPSLQPPYPHVDTSTHPQTHQKRAEFRLDRNKAELKAILEVRLLGHKPGTKCTDTSCRFVAGGYPTPSWKNGNVSPKLNQSVSSARQHGYLPRLPHQQRSGPLLQRGFPEFGSGYGPRKAFQSVRDAHAWRG